MEFPIPLIDLISLNYCSKSFDYFIKNKLSMRIIFIFLLFVMVSPLFANLIKNIDEDSMQVKEGYITVPGGKTWYKIYGTDKSQIPVILIHGGPGGASDYLEPISGLAEHRPVIFYDQLGCGNSPQSDPEDSTLWTIENFVEELSCLINQLNIEEVHLLGQSWGCIVAVEYMLRKKDNSVKSLVLSGPCLNAEKWILDQRNYLKQLDDSLHQIIYQSEIAGDYSCEEYQKAMMIYYQKHICRLNPWPECINRSFQKMNQKIYLYMWGPSEFSCTGTLKDYNNVEALKNINIPVLLTCGRYDEATPSSTKYYQSKFSSAELYIFEDASHDHHLENTDEYLYVVNKFLK